MQSLEAAFEEAEHILQTARTAPETLSNRVEGDGKSLSIFEKLRALYEQETAQDSEQENKHLKSCCHLLDKLVARDHLNTLIVNLYPENRGYSISLRILPKSAGQGTTSPSGSCSNASSSNSVPERVVETMRWPYHEDELLKCIDNEELPAMLLDLLDTTHSDLFYDGCIIAEVRDYRQCNSQNGCNTYHVLLKPTNQSVIADVNLLANEDTFSMEDKLTLESKIILVSTGPLCLDPSPSIGFADIWMKSEQQPLGTEPIRQLTRKFSQVSLTRKRKLEQYSSSIRCPPLLDFIQRKRAKLYSSTTPSGKTTRKLGEGLPKPIVAPLQLEMPADLPMPSSEIDCLKYIQEYKRPQETSDCTPQLVEEYILEAEQGQVQTNRIKLSILQRPFDSEYLGEIVDTGYRDGENTTSCRFPLGSRTYANQYIQQFTEIFTEEGRKFVTITHNVPGQPPKVRRTAGLKERNVKTVMQVQRQQIHQAQMQQVQLQQHQQQQHQQQQHLVQPQNQIYSSNPAQIQVHMPVMASQQTQVFNVNGNSILSSPPPSNQSNLVNSLNTSSNISNGAVISNLIGTSTVFSDSTSLSLPAVVQSSVGTVQQNLNNGTIQPISHQSSPLQQLSAKQPVTSRQFTNPDISALAMSLMNSADEYEQQAAAAKAAANASLSNSANTVGVQNSQNSVQPSPSSSNAAICRLTNNLSGSQTVINNSAMSTLNQKLSNKMTLTYLLNSRLMNHNNSVPSGVNSLVQNSVGIQAQQNQQQQVRVTIASLPASTPSSQSQTISIATNNAGFPPNMNSTSVPSHNPCLSKALGSQQVITGRLVNTTGMSSTGTVRRLSSVSSPSATSANPSNDSCNSSNATSLGLSPSLSAMLAGPPCSDKTGPNSTLSLLDLLNTSPVGLNTTPSSPYSQLPASSPGTPQFTSPSPKNQFLAQSPSPKTQFPVQSPKPPATPSPLSSPPQQSLHSLQGLSIAGLQGAVANIPNMQVTIAGIPVPITLSLNVSQPSAQTGGVIVTTLPVATTTTVTCSNLTSMVSSVPNVASLGSAGSNSTMVFTSSAGTTGQILSLPVAQLMASGVKTNLRTSGNAATMVSLPQGSNQPIQLVGFQRPRKVINQISGIPSKQAITNRAIINAQRHAVKVQSPNTGSTQLATALTGAGVPANQVVTAAQQQLQYALQKQHIQILSQPQQKATVSPAAVAGKHRRRSNAADPNK